MTQKYACNTSIKYKEQATKQSVVMIPLLVFMDSIDNMLRPKKKKKQNWKNIWQNVAVAILEWLDDGQFLFYSFCLSAFSKFSAVNVYDFYK